MPEELSDAERARRERIIRILRENYSAAVMGDRSAWRRIMRSQGREPTPEEKAEFRRADGVPVLQAARHFSMLGLDEPAGFADKVRKATDAYNAGVAGDLTAWQRAHALTTGAKMTADEIRRYRIVGGPPPLGIERQHQLLGGDKVRPQGHIDQLNKLAEQYRRGLAGDPDALRWLEAAFGHPAGALRPKDLLGADGTPLEFGGMTDGLVPGRSDIFGGLAGIPGDGPPGGLTRRRGGRGSRPDEQPAPRDQQPHREPAQPVYDDPAVDMLWPPHQPGSTDAGTPDSTPQQRDPDPVWKQAADALRGPTGTATADDDIGITGPRGTTDTTPPASPDMDTFGPKDDGRRDNKPRGDVEEADDFEVEVPPTVLGYVIVDADGDGQYEARDPNTWENKGTYTPPADTTDDGDADATDDGDADATDDSEDDAKPATADPDADDPGGDEDGEDTDSMPNPMDDGTSVVIDPNRPPIQIVIGGGDPVGPDDEGLPSRNATGPLIRGRNKGDIDPHPDANDLTISIDPRKPPIQIVIVGGDPAGPDVDGGDGSGPGRPGSDDAIGPLIPNGIDPKTRRNRPPL